MLFWVIFCVFGAQRGLMIIFGSEDLEEDEK